jgi:hypothetical protein
MPSAVPDTRKPDDSPGVGSEWIVDAFGCAAEFLRDEARLRGVFDRLVRDLGISSRLRAV